MQAVLLISIFGSLGFAITGCSSGGSAKITTDPNADYNGPLGDPAYWLESTSVKVQPTTVPGTMSGSIKLEGPRDSVAAYQIVVRPTGGGMRHVNATASDLASSSGTIAAANVTLFREFFIDFGSIDRKFNKGGVSPAPESSPTHDSRVPDPLIPFVDPVTGGPLGAPFGVQPDTNLPIWVDVQIPAKAAPGTYAGTITITSDDRAPLAVPITLEVWNLTLPKSNSVTTQFRIDWGSVNGFHDGMDTAFPNEHPKTMPIVKRYQELAHTHRIDPRQINIPYPNGCTPPDDWTAFDAVLGPYLDGSYWDDKVPSTYFDMGLQVGDRNLTCTKAQYIAVARAWATHLKAKGWFQQSWVYATDEPQASDYPVIAQQSAWLQEADPDFKPRIIDTTAPTTGTASLLNSALGVYVLCLKCFDSWELVDDPAHPNDHVYGRAEWPGLLSQGTGMWFYESIAQDAPYPGFATNTLDAAEPRIMMWGSWYEGATGFLYYAITGWSLDEPWGPNINFPKTGDGVLFYPGNHDGKLAPAGSPPNLSTEGPIPSMRLKMVRSGLEDWALFKLANDHGLGNMARMQVARAYSQFGGCTYQGCTIPPFYWKTDYDLLTEVRRNIATALMSAGVHGP